MPVDLGHSGFWTLSLQGVAAAAFWRQDLSRIGTGVDVLTHVHGATLLGRRGQAQPPTPEVLPMEG